MTCATVMPSGRRCSLLQDHLHYPKWARWEVWRVRTAPMMLYVWWPDRRPRKFG